MAEAMNLQRFRNPWALQLQKLGLELKCPICLSLLNRPMLLPCNHILCRSCVPRTANVGSECPACNHQYSNQEIRMAPYMESIVTIYSSLDAISRSIFQPSSSDNFHASSAMTVPDRTNGVPSGSSKEFVSDGKKVITLRASERNLAIHNGCGSDQNSPAGRTDRGSVSTFKAKQPFGRAETEEMEMNQVQELLPESPPSFGDAKNIDSKIADSDVRESNAEKLTLKRSSESLVDADGGGTPPHSNNLVKRQKALTFCLSETGGNNSYNHEKFSPLGSSATSNCNLGPEHEQTLPFADSIALAHSLDSTMTACAFCHSSKITEKTGKMTHVANGREVAEDFSKLSDVIPVHIKCIDWTPRVFFEGDHIRNLESELGRAAKLKCSMCGLKGAALGCFAKSCRRTYHAPCAFEIQDCRWDCEDFLMLCPMHSSMKFPKERSRLRKSITRKNPLSADSNQMTEVSDFWKALPNGPLEWVFCGSTLSPDEKCLLIKFAGMCGATVSKLWNPNITHVLAATNEKGACTRTLKVLMAVLNGRWILTMEWVKACMEAGIPMNEEPYEVGLDNHGCVDGPKTGRLRILSNAPRLFEGLKFYFSGEFVPAYKVDLLDLVRTAGGTIIESTEQLMMESKGVLSVSSSLLIVYNREPPRGCAVGEENSILLQRLTEAKCIASLTKSQVIQHTWILESIAACKLHPFASQSQ